MNCPENAFGRPGPKGPGPARSITAVGCSVMLLEQVRTSTDGDLFAGSLMKYK